jgi:hypothetical protein
VILEDFFPRRLSDTDEARNAYWSYATSLRRLIELHEMTGKCPHLRFSRVWDYDRRLRIVFDIDDVVCDMIQIPHKSMCSLERDYREPGEPVVRLGLVTPDEGFEHLLTDAELAKTSAAFDEHVRGTKIFL